MAVGLNSADCGASLSLPEVLSDMALGSRENQRDFY